MRRGEVWSWSLPVLGCRAARSLRWGVASWDEAWRSLELALPVLACAAERSLRCGVATWDVARRGATYRSSLISSFEVLDVFFKAEGCGGKTDTTGTLKKRAKQIQNI
jgi:hypothetical protein